jgi:hypothetical protein
MATVNKDFKVKNGLIVEGASGTINNQTILTEVDGDAYILDLIGGETLITSVSNAFSVADGELSLNYSEIDPRYDAANSASQAQQAAEDYADGVAGQAQSAAEGYADTVAGQAYSNAQSYADGVAGQAQSAAEGYADTVAGQAYSNAQSYADGVAGQAQSAAEGYADTVAGQAYSNAQSYADGVASQAQSAAEGFATQAIANLVDSAPETLDTLNELAAALQDNPEIISDLQDIAAGKQDTLTAGNGIDITGDTISVAFDAGNGLAINGVNLTVDTNVIATKDYADGVAGQAQSAAEGYADGVAGQAYSNAQSYADGVAGQAYSNAQSYADGVAGQAQSAAEGYADTVAGQAYSNAQSYADGVAGQAQSAAEGYADTAIGLLDTDDIEEGSTNQYFTDERVIDAIDNSVINPQVVEINMIARQVAAIVEDITTATTVTGYAFAKADYRSAEFLVRVAYGAHTEISKVLLTLDTSDNIAITEYGIVGTNGSAMVVSADISGTDVRLRVQTLNNNSTVTVMGTLLV